MNAPPERQTVLHSWCRQSDWSAPTVIGGRGASYAAMALSGDTRTRRQVDAETLGVVHALSPYAYRCPCGSATADECGERSARHIADLIDEHGERCVADEVMSGFGRCGEWFAWQRYGEEGRPDLMTLAKGLTGAHLPLGASLKMLVKKAMERDVSFAIRGNLILLAPPLVILENELEDAMALLDQLLEELV